jgi:hypothetical protein
VDGITLPSELECEANVVDSMGGTRLAKALWPVDRAWMVDCLMVMVEAGCGTEPTDEMRGPGGDRAEPRALGGD